MEREDPLTGGHTTEEVVRVGQTVRRTTTHNAEFVGALLRYLEQMGLRVAPRYLGKDDRGRDVLEFIPGNTTLHPSERDERAYPEAGHMLRALHDATAGHELADGYECVVHGDPGTYNTIFREGMPVAFIDWDSAHPGERMWDLGYIGWTWCIDASGYTPIDDQARRLRRFQDAYGDINGAALLTQIEACQTHVADTARDLLARPGQPAAFYDHHRSAITWASEGKCRSDATPKPIRGRPALAGGQTRNPAS